MKMGLNITCEYLDGKTQISGLVENGLTTVTDVSEITNEYLDRSSEVSGVEKPITNETSNIIDEYLDGQTQVSDLSKITNEYLDRSTEVSCLVEKLLKPITNEISDITDEYLDGNTQVSEITYASEITNEYLDRSIEVSDLVEKLLKPITTCTSDITDEYLDGKTQVSGSVENGLKPVADLSKITNEYLDRSTGVSGVEELLKPITTCTSNITDEYLDGKTQVSSLVENGLKPVTDETSEITKEYLDGKTQVSGLVDNGLKPVTDETSEITKEYLDGKTQVSGLVDNGLKPITDVNDVSCGYLDSTRNCSPRMKYICFRDFNSNDTRNKAPRTLTCTVINTFDSLEHDTFDAIVSAMPDTPVYSIGPLHLVADQIIQDNKLNRIGSNLWKEEPDCVKWLNSKEPNSVVYVNFDSVVVMTLENLIEFAWGLAYSKRQFLWIVRPDLVKGDVASFLPEFISEIKDRGMIASCCKFACTKWGTGMEISSDVKRDQVEMLVRELMDGEKGIEMKANALE
ncbi:UDP-glucuronosyl/UDP-glucosyltransferase [Corchorus capsularis]|uniref:UDP-glucuronosyl/UDP-glucosyltransferase n=1 Tax=Corchorus capsularis TaxID=210143 RepID=A0A1R3I988_COCAP|nr:UDP-glucuronosyl/UDP-glucosyltransferase [Corchorus capsularis]